jgi:hypothetical protein
MSEKVLWILACWALLGLIAAMLFGWLMPKDENHGRPKD